jgi:signal transduction histidine kinase
LQQVIMNLVTNASEALGENDGMILIHTAVTHAGSNGSGAATGDWVRMEVSDTGCGMNAADQHKIFDPFFTTKPSGHGLAWR